MKRSWDKSVGKPSLLRGLVVAAVVASTAGACAEAGRPAEPSASVSPLRSEVPGIALVEWRLVHLVDDAGAWQVPEELDPVLRFDGRGGFSANGCNSFSGRATVGPDRISDVRDVSGTEMACQGPEESRLDAALRAAVPGSWTLEDGRLMIRSDEGLELTFRERDSIYPEAAARTVLVGDRPGAQYRLAVTGGDPVVTGLVFEYRQAPGMEWGESWIAAPSQGEPPIGMIIGQPMADAHFVAGFAPAATARVTHRSSAGHLVDLELDEAVAAPQWVIWSGFVPEHDPASEVYAYDSAGRVVAARDKTP